MTETEKQRIEELKKLASAATPGPWEYDEDDNRYWPITMLADGHSPCGIYPVSEIRVPLEMQDVNGAFIAESRTAIPWLVELVEKAYYDQEVFSAEYDENVKLHFENLELKKELEAHRIMDNAPLLKKQNERINMLKDAIEDHLQLCREQPENYEEYAASVEELRSKLEEK